jgi:hypothetical protein
MDIIPGVVGTEVNMADIPETYNLHLMYMLDSDIAKLKRLDLNLKTAEFRRESDLSRCKKVTLGQCEEWTISNRHWTWHDRLCFCCHPFTIMVSHTFIFVRNL